MIDKEAYRKKMESQFEELKAKVDLINAKLKNKKASVDINSMQALEQIKVKKQIALEKLNLLKESGSDLWEESKNITDNAFEEYKQSVKSFLDELEGK